MRIHGLQKMTLLDYPGKVACTVFTAGCNFRCPFCHNAPLVTEVSPDASFSEEEVLRFLDKRRGLLDGVCVTGGEPLLQPDILRFLTEIRRRGYAIKLDTNGSFPDRLQEIVAAGLADYVAMDIKNAPERYEITAGIGADLLPAIRESVAFLLRGTVPYEFRTTVAAELHTAEDLEAIGRWIAGADSYFIQPFVDSGNLVGTQPLTAPSADSLAQMLAAVTPYVPAAALRGAD